MTKEPIMVQPAWEQVQMGSTSRIKFGETYNIGWGAMVRDIGMVASHHRKKLLHYHEEEQDADFDSVLPFDSLPAPTPVQVSDRHPSTKLPAIREDFTGESKWRSPYAARQKDQYEIGSDVSSDEIITVSRRKPRVSCICYCCARIRVCYEGILIATE
jgi:hypothetical protein